MVNNKIKTESEEALLSRQQKNLYEEVINKGRGAI